MVKQPVEVLTDLRNIIVNESVAWASRGARAFEGYGVVVTEDKEDIYVNPEKPVTIVETEYVTEVSWLFQMLKEHLDDVTAYFPKELFYGRLADAANSYIVKFKGDEGDPSLDVEGLLMAILMEASLMTIESQQFKNQAMRDEVVACIGSLSDVVEKI